MNEHYDNVKTAVSQAHLGEDPLKANELALAITVGLRDWVSSEKEQIKLMLEVMDALAFMTGEPIDIHNRVEEHKNEPLSL